MAPTHHHVAPTHHHVAPTHHNRFDLHPSRKPVPRAAAAHTQGPPARSGRAHAPSPDTRSADTLSREDRRALLAWYDARRRDLPWRDVDDPYATWVSEVMLQQTRVETVIPYFLRWMARFPTVRALADAEEDQMLHLWQGLGYYSRARALHRAAKQLRDTTDGRMPENHAALLGLPGIGPYTAAAIASIAFGEAVAAVDGNVLRVIARHRAIEDDILSTRGRRHVADVAEAWVDEARPGDWNQAIMELGATVCTPRSPRCGSCPIGATCRARADDRVDTLPVRRRARPRKQEHHDVLLVTDPQDNVLVVKQDGDGLLGGLWRLPMGRDMAQAWREAALAPTAPVARPRHLGDVYHVFTHKEWHLRVHHITTPREPATMHVDRDDDVDARMTDPNTSDEPTAEADARMTDAGTSPDARPRTRWIPLDRGVAEPEIGISTAHRKAIALLLQDAAEPTPASR